jgi:DNA-binding MarR family transcriptional regulator
MASGPLDRRTGFLLHRLGLSVEQAIEAVLQPRGVRPREFRVLTIIAASGAGSQADLARASGLDRTTMVAVIDRLEASGWVRRVRDPADRRRQAVLLTAEGESLLLKATAALDAAEDDYLSPLSAAERTSLNGLLNRLHDVHDPHCLS